MRNAGHVVAISDAFVAKYEQWGLATDHVSVIANWASFDDVRPVERDNAWSRAHAAVDEVRLLYSGTLGRKHNPMLLPKLLDKVHARGVGPSLTVCSEGVGADDLKRVATLRDDIRILGFQPAEDFAQVLSSADIVVALLEPDASKFSVPSKVLSYLSAGRAVVGLMPAGNPAAQDIRDAAGFVSTPDDPGTALAAEWIDAHARPADLARIGAQARRFAERRFYIKAIADQFEVIVNDVSR